MRSSAELDVVVYGASGFTGQLVAEYLSGRVKAGAKVKWAMAGRSETKLASVRDAIGAPADTPLITADGSDPASLMAMAARTKVVLTTVGPYQLYGSELVAACARGGTDYVDLCGEPAWMRAMIDAHHTHAQQSGARIVFSCGYDSIPFDLGVLLLQTRARAQFGAPCPRVLGRVRKMKGTFSGGTAASLKATLAAAAKDPRVVALLKDPFSLTPGFAGPAQPHGMKPYHDDVIGSWVAPFVMAAINTRNVHRTNFLLGKAYGADLVYDEMVVTGAGEKGEAIAKAVAEDRSMMKEGGPKPGEGPSKVERETGFYDLLFVGIAADGRTLRAGVTGKRDPGYGSTSRMITESALCLIENVPTKPGGIWTPGALMGEPLMERLRRYADMTFEIEEV